MSNLVQVLLRNSHRLAEFVEPTVNWCGTEGCLHRGSEHGLSNRCLICDCETFSTRPREADIATALRFLL